MEDIREKKIETNTEAARLIDEIQKFTTSYISQIQEQRSIMIIMIDDDWQDYWIPIKSHSEKLIEKVQKNRQKKIQNHEAKIAEIERLENKTESALGMRLQ